MARRIISKRMKGLGARSAGVYLALRDALEGGQYRVGEKLPTEAALCETLSVSRTALRRAIGQLVEEGYLQVRQGSGMYVCRRAGAASGGSQTISIMYNFGAEDLTTAQDYLLARGYLLCVYSQLRSHWDLEAERSFLERVQTQRHRALLAFCSPLEPRNDEALAALDAAGTRVIHVEPYTVAPPAQEYLLPDYEKAGHMAAIRLLLAGYERLVFVGVNKEAPYHRLVRQGLAAALAEHGGGFDPGREMHIIPQGIGDRPGAQGEFVEWVRALGTTVGIVLDSVGLGGVLQPLLEGAGFAVPERVGLIGPQLVGPRKGASVDSLVFDRDALLRRAMDAAMADEETRLCELVAPAVERRGSVRGRE